MTRLDEVASVCAGLLEADETLKFHQAQEPLRLHALGDASGRMLTLITVMARPKSILELGTGMGYSTLWLAQGAARIDARVTTVECNANKQLAAQGLLRRYDLDKHVEFHNVDAATYLASQSASPGLVFLDVDKPDYLAITRLLMSLKRREPTILLADNLLSHRSELAGFVAALDEQETIEHTLIPIGKGLELALLDQNIEEGR
jgi:predicted O-methyltransferase YrrM